MRRRIAIIAGLGLMLFSGLVYAEESASVSPPVLIENVTGFEDQARYTLPAGTALQILLQTPVDTAINQPGDPVEGLMAHNLYLHEHIILPKNIRFNGIISRLEAPFQGRDAVLAIRFTEIILDGRKVPIEAHVRTNNPEHTWGGNLTPGTKPMRSIQRVWGIGEYNRIVYGGPRAMGSHVRFSPGEHWTIILEQPLVLAPPEP